MTNSDRQSKKAGLPPGALVHVGDRKADKVRIRVIDFNTTDIHQYEPETIEGCFPFRDSANVSWINIDGLHDTDLIKKLGDHFGLHPLLQEDILNTNGRPKLEVYENHLFLIAKMHGVTEDTTKLVSEQVSFILGKNWVISFQEQEGDVFNDFRIRLEDPMALTRKNGADYLLYRLVDNIVDNYFQVLEHISDDAERLEVRVIESPDDEAMKMILDARKTLIFLRRTIFPLREAMNMLEKETGGLITKNTSRYLRDVHDHIIQVTESIEIYRDMTNSIMDLHMSGVSNKMNQVMKVLTIISTIFIPMTFIAGIYGMNFDHMPELHFRYGYFGALGVMVGICIVMLIYFKRKDWF